MLQSKDLDFKSYSGGGGYIVDKILRKVFSREVTVEKFYQYMSKSHHEYYLIILSEVSARGEKFFTTQMYDENAFFIEENLSETMKEALLILKAYEKKLRIKDKHNLIEKEERIMIKLKEGQKVIDKDGNTYLIESGDCLVEGIGKGALSWLQKIYKDFNQDPFNAEWVDLRIDHSIVKITSKKYSLEQIEGILNISYKFGISGNGLTYKVIPKLKEVWVFSWDLKLDSKWHQIWK